MITFENEVERDFYDFLVNKKGCRESTVGNCVKELREIQPLDKLINLCLERKINLLKCLLEYKDANFNKYGWGKATANYTTEELAELHSWMRRD